MNVGGKSKTKNRSFFDFIETWMEFMACLKNDHFELVENGVAVLGPVLLYEWCCVLFLPDMGSNDTDGGHARDRCRLLAPMGGPRWR